MPTDLNDDPDGPRSFLRRHRRRLVVASTSVGVPVLVFVLWWFQPQALLFDDVVDEEFPVGVAADEAATAVDEESDSAADLGSTDPDGDADVGSSTSEPAPPERAEPALSGPLELASGTFVSRNRYTVTGTATTYQLEDGQRLLRLEDFESTNGPDLFVLLTVAGTADDDAALDAAFVDLGALAGNIGNQNYLIPDDVDLEIYDSVTIWCRRFTTSFGVADLSTP